MSVSPWVEVNPETWEIINDLEHNRGAPKESKKHIPSKYSQRSIDLVRMVTGEACEDILSKITKWKSVKRWNNRWFDIFLKDWKRIEAKVWRTNKPAVVKESQLWELSDFYGFVYYSTKWWFPPSYYTSRENGLSSTVDLKRNIFFRFAVILPSPVVTYHYNTIDTVRRIISTTWVAHRGMSKNQAIALYDSNEWEYSEKSNFQFGYWRHDIDVYALWINLWN